jgi:MHS family proline/betaine transporter-like MFS transporter
LRAHFGWFKRRHEVTISDVTVIDRPTLNRAVAAAALGNAMEWFDFGVYGYLAVTLGQVFFPGDKPAVQLIAALAAFTAALSSARWAASCWGLWGIAMAATRCWP